MFDFVTTVRHRISQARTKRRLDHDLNPSPRRTSFGETIAIGLGCDSQVPKPRRTELG
jgi:hypothetical protein